MKTWKLDVNGKRYIVQIENPNTSPVSVTVNGKAFQVTLVEEINMTTKPVTVLDVEDEKYETYMPDMASTFLTQVVDVGQGSPTTTSTTSAGGVKVTAPMPGKVLDIVVGIGDMVKVGDTLCNLEAMKMKSPIRSTAAGKIVQIAVSEGQSVNYGDVLFVLG